MKQFQEGGMKQFFMRPHVSVHSKLPDAQSIDQPSMASYPS